MQVTLEKISTPSTQFYQSSILLIAIAILAPVLHSKQNRISKNNFLAVIQLAISLLPQNSPTSTTAC